jgi:hypothetical protein
VPLLRREIAATDPDVTLFNVRPLVELMDDSRLQPRLIGTVIAVFAGIALLVSVVGLYAVTHMQCCSGRTRLASEWRLEPSRCS